MAISDDEAQGGGTLKPTRGQVTGAQAGAARPTVAVERDRTLEWDLKAEPVREVVVGEVTTSPVAAGNSETAGVSLEPDIDVEISDDVPYDAGGSMEEKAMFAKVAAASEARGVPDLVAAGVDPASQLGAAPEGPRPLIEEPTAPLPVDDLVPVGATDPGLGVKTPLPEAPAAAHGKLAPRVEATASTNQPGIAAEQSMHSPMVTPPPVPEIAITGMGAGKAMPPKVVPPPPPAAVTKLSGDDAATRVPAPRVPPIPAAAIDHVPGGGMGEEGWVEPLKPRARSKRAKPWYEEVFDEDYLRTLPFMTAEQTLREANFIHACLGVPEGGEILDVGCGYGRHAIELAQRGLKVTGLDLSLPLLIRAADEAQRRQLAVNFVHADMREMNFDSQFDGAYCALTTFGYFDEETNLKVATGIARSLKPGGRFLLDTLNRDYIVSELPTRVWWEGDGCVVLEEVDFNFHTSRVGIRRSMVFQDGRQFEHDISIRAYSLHEIGRLLRQAGFRVLEVSGSIATRGRFFGATSRSVITVCERPPE